MSASTPASEPAKLRLTRREHWFDRSHEYHVQLDGRVLGNVDAGETREFEISPGSHSVEIRVGKCTSPLRMFNVKAGETVALECGCRLKGWKAMVAPWYLLVGRNKYLELTKVG